ncbi:cytochrome c biogenesis CcdA family protein [Candidatus Auribacterota bacterium]
MILSLFEWLSNALNQNAFFALSAAFIWGVLSILLSPCHLASLPLIIGFINDQGKISTKRAFALSSLFSIGILLTIFFIGLLTSWMGRMVGDIGVWGIYFVALIFFMVGIYLLGFIPFSFLSPSQVNMKKKGLFASFILGLIFGLALGPCTFAYMAPVLGISFSLAKENIIYAISLMVLYGIGHCLVIVLAGTFTEIVQNYLNWNEKSKGTLIIKKICGVLVIAGGIYLIVIAQR